MSNLEIYCTSTKYFNIIDKLPSYIKPLGLGNADFPAHWLTEKNGENISNLNKNYGEATAFYWIWKNKLKNKNENDWVGSCQHRRLWLNNLYHKKQKFSSDSLYANLLEPNNSIYKMTLLGAQWDFGGQEGSYNEVCVKSKQEILKKYNGKGLINRYFYRTLNRYEEVLK